MSFGFGVSDFIAVGELAFKLYRDCYLVARGAPQDFKLLVIELSSLSSSINIVRQAVQDPGSALIQAGEERIRSVNGLEIGINDTLTRLEKIIKKYGALSSASTRKTFWAKFKWSMESRNIDGLRAKLVYHNTMMNLLLTSVGNSSLQRIEETHTALTRDIAAIKSFISGHQVENSPSVKSPALSVVDGDEVSGENLNAAFMKNAEIDQPWSTIGIDRWVEAGRWWLMIAQMELLHISTSEHSVVPYSAYVSLIKAFWILMDVITCHPQLPFHTAGSQAEIRVLSTEIRGEFTSLSRLGLVLPRLRELQNQDMQIWANSTRGSLLRPRWTSEQDIYPQIPSGERVLLQRHVVCTLSTESTDVPCILLFLVSEDAKSARIIAQNQSGSIMVAIAFTEPVTLSLYKAATKAILVDGELLTFRELSGDVHALSCLIEAINFCFFEINTSDNDLRTVEAYVLIFAVKNECGDVITQLVKSKSLKEGSDGRMSQISPSGVALSMISHYMESGPPQEIVASDFESISSVSLLDWAVRRRQTALLALLLSENVPYQPPDQFLFLLEECQSDHIAQLLLEYSLQNELPQERYGRYRTRVEFAARFGLTTITRLLLCHICTDDPFHVELCHEAFLWGAYGEHAELVRSLVSAGLNIDARDKEGLSALMHVVGRDCPFRWGTDHAQPLTILLENGASTEEHGPCGKSMQHMALIGSLDDEIIYPILSTEIQSRQQIRSVAPHIQWNMAEMLVTIRNLEFLHGVDILVENYYAFVQRRSYKLETHRIPRRRVRNVNLRRWNKLISIGGLDYERDLNYKDRMTLSFNILFANTLSNSLDISVNLHTEYFPSRKTLADVLSDPDLFKSEWWSMSTSVTAQVRNGGGFQVNLSYEKPFHSFKDIATDPNSAPESQVGEEQTILEEDEEEETISEEDD